MKMIEFYYRTWDHESDSIRAEKPAIAVLQLLETHKRNLYEVWNYNTDGERVVYYSSEGIKNVH